MSNADPAGPATPPSPLHLRIDADTAQLKPVRQQVEAFAASAGFDDVAVGEVGLCVNEAMANILRHAYHNKPGQPIEIDASLDASNVLHVKLRDWGDGKPPTVPLPDKTTNPLRPGGLGLICMGRLMDKVSFTPQRDGMLLEMFKKRRPAGAPTPKCC